MQNFKDSSIIVSIPVGLKEELEVFCAINKTSLRILKNDENLQELVADAILTFMSDYSNDSSEA